MRTVLKTWEVPNFWLAQSQECGRNPQGNFSFRRRDLYSYSTRIGHICENGTVLVSEEGYFNTTKRQINQIPGEYFRVPYLDDTPESHKANVKYYLAEMKRTVLEWWKAQSRWRFNGCLNENAELYRQLQKYCQAFGLDMPVTLGLYLDPSYSFIENRRKKHFWQLPNGNTLFLPKALADKGMENVEPKDILTTRNAEIRREIVRIVGIERICHALKAKTIDKQDNYELILLDLKDGRRRPFLKMLNPSVPDIWHVEGVHPIINTVQDALNYRRHGDDMLELKNMPDDFNWWEQQEFRLDPLNMRIKAEYETSPMFPNENDWNPVKLT